jgi:hypothetical protein
LHAAHRTGAESETRDKDFYSWVLRVHLFSTLVEEFGGRGVNATIKELRAPALPKIVSLRSQ